MELIERAEFLASLKTKFERTVEGEGHCIFISGEAGIGKTALVKAFCEEIKSDHNIYTGTCDALFTPRPLAPLYDIAGEISSDLWKDSNTIEDRAGLFARFFHELGQKEHPVLIFEDIHWADEATLDFIKFFARRITRTSCFFILTFRDNEIHSHHPLTNVLGELVPGSFTRLQLAPLSKQAVEKLAVEKGYKGEDVYEVSGGNPFYVNEILASYSPGIPDSIKDSILAVYNRLDEKTKCIWELLSTLPTGFEVAYLEKIQLQYGDIENCLSVRIIELRGNRFLFKHELYRRTVEESLSPFKRIILNKKILVALKQSFEENGQVERIIHHAKNANENELVVQYAPIAAKRSSLLGSHREASKLYLSAIEYYDGHDTGILAGFCESYAHECYLTNYIKEAIIYQERSLQILRSKDDPEKLGNNLWFLSRLHWCNGSRKEAERFAEEAIEILDIQPASCVKAMAYSNMSQLKMLSDLTEECMYWGEKAIALARELNDDAILSHALNNVGTVKKRNKVSRETGNELLQLSLSIALQNGYDEHAGRTYSNISSAGVLMKEYTSAKKMLDEGIAYCEERDLDSCAKYMWAWKARLHLETGNWQKATTIASRLVENESQVPIIKIGALAVLATIKMRSGDPEALPLLLEAKLKAIETMELQRIIPALVALLEYERITGHTYIQEKELALTIDLISHSDNVFQNSEFAFWLLKVRNRILPLKELYSGYDIATEKKRRNAVALWQELGCPYEQALCLFEGDEEDKRRAIIIVHDLGATAVYEKMKQEMRISGIKKIPRGARESTKQNPAHLTTRELDILQLLKQSMQNKEIASQLFISPKTVDHHISSILFKLDVNSRARAVQEATRLEIVK